MPLQHGHRNMQVAQSEVAQRELRSYDTVKGNS